MADYYKNTMATRHSAVATICDPRYKLAVFEHLYDAEGGVDSIQCKKAKAHFQHTFSDYNRRAIAIQEYDRGVAENAAIDAREARQRSETPEVLGEEAWRDDPYHGFADFVAARPGAAVPASLNTSEGERWFGEPLLELKATVAEQVLYMID